EHKGDGDGRKKAGFWEKRRERAEADIQRRYLDNVLKELGPKKFDRPEPMKLTSEMVDHALKTEAKSPLGERMKSLIAERFSALAEVDGKTERVPLDEHGIRDAFAKMHEELFPPKSAGAISGGEHPPPESRTPGVLDEASQHDAPGAEPGGTHEQRWAAAHAETGTGHGGTEAVDRSRGLFVEVLDRHFGTEDWSRGTVEDVKSMVRRATDTSNRSAATVDEVRTLRTYLENHFTRDGRILDDATIEQKIQDLHRDSRQLVTDPLTHGGAESTHTGPVTGAHDAPPPTPPIDPNTTHGPPAPEAPHAQPKGDLSLHKEGEFEHRYFIERSDGHGNVFTETVSRYHFSLEFERFPVEEFGGPESPAARAALNEAARTVVDAVHDLRVNELDRWLTGVDEHGNPIKLADTELPKIGKMAGAVMLPDGSLHASTSSTHIPEGQRLSRAADMQADGRVSIRGGETANIPKVGNHREAYLLEKAQHPAIQAILDRIPENQRSVFSGMCAEPNVLSDIARSLEPDFQRAFLADVHGVDPKAFDSLPAEQKSLNSLSQPDRLRYDQEFGRHLRNSLDGGRSTAMRTPEGLRGDPEYPCATDDRLLESLGMRADYVDRVAVESYVDGEHGVIGLMRGDDPLLDHVKMLTSKHPDWLVVAVHGDHDANTFAARFGEERLGPVEVNRIVESIVADHPELHGRGKVVLVTCEADKPFAVGDGTSSFSHEFALRHGNDVLAPPENVWVSDAGDLRVAADRPGAEDIAGFEPEVGADGWSHVDGTGRAADPVAIDDIVGKKTGAAGDSWLGASDEHGLGHATTGTGHAAPAEVPGAGRAETAEVPGAGLHRAEAPANAATEPGAHRGTFGDASRGNLIERIRSRLSDLFTRAEEPDPRQAEREQIERDSYQASLRDVQRRFRDAIEADPQVQQARQEVRTAQFDEQRARADAAARHAEADAARADEQFARDQARQFQDHLRQLDPANPDHGRISQYAAQWEHHADQRATDAQQAESRAHQAEQQVADAQRRATEADQRADAITKQASARRPDFWRWANVDVESHYRVVDQNHPGPQTSALTGRDVPPPVWRTRPYGLEHGLREVLHSDQVRLERELGDGTGGFVRTPDPKGAWLRLLNAFGIPGDPTR
ncbi:MAG: hypothetical protein V7603_3502, partial [Micromonosporaceae bacterium]